MASLIPYHFVGQERVLEAPKGYDHEKNGECVGLPVCFHRHDDGAIFGVSSVWKPTRGQVAVLLGVTPEALEQIVSQLGLAEGAGGAVRLTCWGGQPPVALDVVDGDCLKVPA